MDVKTCTNVRNPVRCRRCDSRLLVECLRDVDDPAQSNQFGFPCPVCLNWNTDVPLRGFQLLNVIRDPRKVPRDGSDEPSQK
jgi:hypothetical protein